MKNRAFSLVLILLFILGIGIFLLPQANASKPERRKLNMNDSIDFNDIANTSESVLSDQFYFRNYIMKMYYLVNTSLSSLFGANYVEGIYVTQLSDKVVRLNDGYLAYKAIEYNDDDLYSAASRGFNISEFDNMFSNVKTYIYKCTRIEELINTDFPYQEKCWDAMVYQFNPSITYSKLQVNDYEDFKKYYYKSDRHWNAVGAYQGYCDIINMINKDYDIGLPKKIKNTITYIYKFRGGISSHIALLGESDSISDYELEEIGDYDYYCDGIKCNYNESKINYKNNGNNKPCSDYEAYFGNNAFIKLFDFKNNDKPNLLIFSTSYTNANNLWIASHFNKTLLIDLRSMPENFSLKYYIDEYNIDIALLATGYNSLYFDGYNYIPIN